MRENHRIFIFIYDTMNNTLLALLNPLHHQPSNKSYSTPSPLLVLMGYLLTEKNLKIQTLLKMFNKIRYTRIRTTLYIV